MAERKTGTVIYRQQLTPELEIFRITPEAGSAFPRYKPGQYITLSRDNCRLTKKVVHATGLRRYEFDLDEAGVHRLGTVTSHFSIASAPYQTAQDGYLEFYIVKQLIETNVPGTFSDSLFHVDEKHENKIFYVNEALGDFTLEQRTEGCDHVIMVATGTGVAPFISMLRQLHHEALEGKPSKQRFTLFYSNRSLKELGYHDELTNIERERRFDFVYVPSLSRPTEKDYRNIVLGRGRVTDLLRLVFRLPKNIAGIKKDKAWSSLPKHIEVSELRKRMPAERSVILACGNDEAVAQVERIAKDAKIRCEKEKW